MTLEIETSETTDTLIETMTRIRELRLKLAEAHPKAFSVVALAARLRISDSTLRRWEDGSREPHARHARKLARELGVTVEDLGLDQTEDPPAD